jgi:antitoxin component YwqK of YwqJK toxin-antitoxin module
LRGDKPALSGQFVDGKKDGTWTTYAADGTVLVVATYVGGTLQGPWRQLVDGAVLEGVMDAGRRGGTWTRTDRGGVVSKLTYSTP